MKHLLFILPLLCLAAAPATQPQWSHSPAGDILLRPFAAAPYPHLSRENGFSSSNGTFPKDPHYNDSTVGIVIPPGYVPGDTVDYVVHFHGWGNHVSNVLTQYNLPAQLAAAKVNAILLVPQGPKDAKDSSDGKLELDPGGFKRLITEVTTFLKSEGKIHTDKVGTIALTAHSGGYKVTARILHHGGLTDHISDVILLDASYGNLDDFAEYISHYPTARLISFHTKHLDDENAALQTLLDKSHTPYRTLPEPDLSPTTLAPRTATFISTTLPHDEVPVKKDYFSITLASSALPKVPHR